VIVGGGFGGLYAAKALSETAVRVTLVDKRNFHLFQPLLYQVATGGLSPGDIASPLRSTLGKASNVQVLKAEVVDIYPEKKLIFLRDGLLNYDSLIVATGARYHYFDRPEWADQAPSLKTVEDALEIRRRVLLAFEAAERESDPARRQAWLNFVVVGGGPTGVELAGALGELANGTLSGEFKNIDPAEARIILLEAGDGILASYPDDLATKAQRSLEKLGVTVRVKTRLVGIDDDNVTLRDQESGRDETLASHTVLWAAGVQASALGQILAERVGAKTDHIGRVMIEPDLTVAGQPDIFVVGDLAHFEDQDGRPLPGVAQVAMQQGQYAAGLIQDRLRGSQRPPFRYKDKGNLAVIGRNAAVADLGFARFSGFPAWLIWVFIHIGYLIGFDNKLLVLTQWAWNYFTRKRGARLITGEDPFPLIQGGIDERREPLMQKPARQTLAS
ncbi:MAG: NAD(P)/FAD-dependent oxidoreductase, partial [Chloroflexota bacterium]